MTTILDPRTLLPDGEEMAPDDPTDALGRYTALLMRWDVLSRQQTLYDDACAKLGATGQALAQEWAEVRDEHAACLASLTACPLSLADAIRQVWMLAKVHQLQLVEPTPAHRGFLPEVLRAFLDQRTFCDLGAAHGGAREAGARP
jgi:hypothetical protein